MRYLFILWVLCTHSLAVGAPIPDLIIGKPLPENSQLGPSPIPPSPMDLKSDWWRFFETEPDVLEKRIDTVVQQLNAIDQKLPEGQKPDTQLHIDRIRENLRALLELRRKANPESPPPLPIQTSYSFRQWLDIVHKRRTLQAEFQSENEDRQRKEKRFAAARQRLDSLMAAYLALPDQSQVKEEQGIAIMSEWSGQAINSESLRLQKAALAIQSTQLEQLVEANNTAQDRLFVSAADLRHIKQETDKAKHELNAMLENSAQLSASSVTGNLDTDEGKAESLLLEQQLKHNTVNEAIADAVATRKEIELMLAEILTASNKLEFDRFRKQLQDNLEHIAGIDTRQTVWREEAEQDQERAGKSLAALLGTQAEQNGKLIDLTQQRLSEAQNILQSLQNLDGEIDDARLVAGRIREIVAIREGTLKNGLEAVKASSSKIWEALWDQLGNSLFKIGETPVTMLGILRVLFIITLAWLLSHFVRRGLTHLNERQRGSSAFLYTVSRLTHYLLLIIGVSIGLSSVGVDLSNFAMIAGALSLGIGFGLQAIVSNFVSGLIVLFERSLRIGDFVELSSGVAGEVRAINVRSTLVTTTDMVDILVPNSEFVNGKVINWTLTDASRRIHIPFGVSYGSDKELVRTAALEAAQLTPHTLKHHGGREPEVWLTNFGDSSLDFELVVWVQPQAVKKPQRVRAAYYWELETALAKYGIEIPFPQRDIHIRSGLQKRNLQEATNHPAKVKIEDD
ncbi:MAG: hypothetical protein CTY16_19230 [Methylobacter sp.]|nr:MAG: hypothetical protein CTY16_19230 [Methylobacter sp.]